jgi:hypothetical protein
MLDTLGNLGDFIGGIGVIITVAYLAYQVRLNTNSTRSASYQAAISSVSDWSRETALDLDAVKVLREGALDPSKLDANELAQFDMLTRSLFRNFENIHYQYDTGAIPKEAWDGWGVRICAYLSQPGTDKWWQTQKSAYSIRFQNLQQQL